VAATPESLVLVLSIPLIIYSIQFNYSFTIALISSSVNDFRHGNVATPFAAFGTGHPLTAPPTASEYALLG
jgi:hypothetical protein